MVVVVITMKCEGGIAAIIPTIVLKKFGMTRGHDVFSFIYSSYGMSSILGSVFNATVGAYFGMGGMVVVGGCFVLLAAILTYRQDDNHTFNYCKLFPDKIQTYGDVFSNQYGKQVRDMGIQYEFLEPKAPVRENTLARPHRRKSQYKVANVHKPSQRQLNFIAISIMRGNKDSL